MQIIILWCEGNGKQDVFLVMFLFRIHTSVETDKRIRKFLINTQHLLPPCYPEDLLPATCLKVELVGTLDISCTEFDADC